MGWRSASRPGDPAIARRCAIFAASGHGVWLSSGASFAENLIERHPIDPRFRDDERARFCYKGADQGLNRPNRSGETNYCKFIQPSRNAGSEADRGSPIGLFFVHNSA